MFKQSPSRNHRSKSVKVKHVLQFCVLLAVCFWLIYQVKRSHDNKKEFDENSAKISLKVHAIDNILKFGRKDLHPRLEETVAKNGNRDEEVDAEEDEETGGGGGGGGEESKHEEEDSGAEEEERKHEEDGQEEDSKPEEKEDEGRGGGDDEIDEHDQEKSEMELEREEDFLDGKEGEEDEREAENKDSEDSEGQSENESSSDRHDHDENNENDHEAREEHYKADDASSAVTHESRDIGTETERESLEKNEYPEAEVSELENGGNNMAELNAGTFIEGAISIENEMDENGIPRNGTDTGVSTIGLSNERETISILTEVQNNAEGSLTSREVNNLGHTVLDQTSDSSLHSTSSMNVLNGEVNPGESSNSSSTSQFSLQENALISNASAEVKDHSGSLATDQNVGEAGNEESESSNRITLINQLTEDLGLSKSDTLEEVRQDQINSSDSSVRLEEHDIHTELGTLAEIRTEGSSNEDAAAE